MRSGPPHRIQKDMSMSGKLSIGEGSGSKDSSTLDSAVHAVAADSSLNRRDFLAAIAGTALLTAVGPREAFAANADEPVNLAKIATPSSLYTSGDTSISALNDGKTPANSHDRGNGAYGNWPRVDAQWVQYDWSKPITTGRDQRLLVGGRRRHRITRVLPGPLLEWKRFRPGRESQRPGSCRKRFQHHHLRPSAHQ